MYKYQDRLDAIIHEDFTLITKLRLLYEINCILVSRCPDWLVDKIYQAYLDNGNYFNANAYINAISDWCESNGTPFDLIDDYDKMLKEIY